MNQRAFHKLLDKVRAQIMHYENMCALRNGVVETEVRFSFVLRITAGASRLNMMPIWSFSHPRFLNFFRRNGVITA